MDPNIYLAKHYESPPCWLLVRDVYETELGRSVNQYRTVNTSVQELSRTFDQRFEKDRFGFAQIDSPADMCVVFLGRNRRTGIHHAGIYWQGSVLHALDDGIYLQDLASLGDQYSLVEYWALP